MRCIRVIIPRFKRIRNDCMFWKKQLTRSYHQMSKSSQKINMILIHCKVSLKISQQCPYMCTCDPSNHPKFFWYIVEGSFIPSTNHALYFHSYALWKYKFWTFIYLFKKKKTRKQTCINFGLCIFLKHGFEANISARTVLFIMTYVKGDIGTPLPPPYTALSLSFFPSFFL